MKLIIPLSLLAITTAQSVTFVIGDGFALDGSGTFGSAPNDSPFSSPGNAGRDESITDAETSYRYNLTQSAFTGSPFGSSDPFIAGSINFGDMDVFRSGLEFNLSGLPALPAGGTYVVDSITLLLEVANSTFNNGIPSDGESVTVNVIPTTDIVADITAASVAAPATSFTLTNPDDEAFGGEFFTPISLPTSLLDLNTDGSFALLLDSTDPTVAATFGTGFGDDGVGLTSTSSINVSPTLVIEATVVGVPEPSVVSLSALVGLGLLTRRNRKA